MVDATIALLSPALASQIAAGEVVERPASAVKELIENALDAGAQRVDVEIEGGGVTRLCVSDDGSGMNAENARLCVERHATSKLRDISDLNRIESYGFRGEALPSIASVSRFALRTRSAADDAGVEISIEGGAAPTLRPTGVAVGTRVDVRDLFFNVPARRKFLRSTGTESGHVTEVVEAAALTRPEVTFTLARDGRTVREFLRASGRAERVAQVSQGEELTRCEGTRGPLRIEAFLSRPEHARSGAGGLRLFVNGRSVRDRAIAVTIAQAYGSVLERGRYPRGIVHLDLPPEFLDVNVHPQKAEVRFADPRALADALYGTLSRALASAFSLPTPNRSAWGKSRTEPALGVAATPLATAPRAEPGERSAVAARLEPEQTYVAAETTLHSTANLPLESLLAAEPSLIAVRDSAALPIRPQPTVAWASLRFVAQLRQTYLLCESADGIYLLDQHAAAERVTFTRLRKQYQGRAVPSQSLLFPVLLDVLPAEAELVELRGKEMAEVGLDVRVRGPESISIHSVPKLLQRASAERLLRDLLSEVSRKGGRGFSDAVDLALATMACHGSIRAGDPLAPDEVKALLEALDDADFAGHCPHGRPVVTFLSWAELERKVGRR
ncbi:MAG TPA: DNA mismatch repair endonuclease MutL [Polyangiaceae bacterium]|jgi:DNA mismatch repair protein MutL|nr:DNA mismatch repair endonuclease MutL [Polyangiaceae bacterium]